MKTLVMATLTASLFALTPAQARAQNLGTFQWQLSPFCNVLTLTVVQQGAFYNLSGMDDGCGVDGTSPITGTAYLEPGNTVSMGLTTVSSLGGGRNYFVTLSLATLSGTWREGGVSGPFVYNPARPTTGSPVSLAIESVFAFAQIRADASIRHGSPRVLSVDKPGTGVYCINLTPPPSVARLESTVVGLAGGSPAAVFARVTNGQAGPGAECPVDGALRIYVTTTAGAAADARFSFVVP